MVLYIENVIRRKHVKRFSKSIFLTVLVIAMAIALVGCKSAQVEPLEPAEPQVEQPAETPAEQPAETPAEQPAEQPEAPAEEPVAPAEAPAEEPAAPAEEPAEEPVEVAELPEWTISLYGYEAKIVYENKVATITYPSFITNAEILNAAAAAYAVYGAYLQGTELAVDNGTAWLTFPADVSYADIDASVRLLAAELPNYVASVVLAEAPAAAPAEVAEVIAEEPAVVTIERTFSILGYEASIVYQDKVAVITYPDFITNAEVAQAAKTAYAAYSKYLKGTELTIDNGMAVLTFPVEITADDIDFAVALLSAELPAYVAAVLAPQPEEVATVAEAPAAEAPAEQPAAAPAAEAPAEQPAAAPAAEAPATTPAEQPAAAPATQPAASTSTTPAASTTTTPAAFSCSFSRLSAILNLYIFHCVFIIFSLSLQR